MVDFNHRLGLIGKITIPPGFGLAPFLHQEETVHADPSAPKEYRSSIEFRLATPLEYLDRWSACNEVFGDAVRVASVILWKDGLISICIIQPQYPGERADQRDIRRYFEENGWQHIKDPSGHEIFYHYSYQIMAIDAVGRNCFIDSLGIQPFDVILCSPDEDIEKYLAIY